MKAVHIALPRKKPCNAFTEVQGQNYLKCVQGGVSGLFRGSHSRSKYAPSIAAGGGTAAERSTQATTATLSSSGHRGRSCRSTCTRDAVRCTLLHDNSGTSSTRCLVFPAILMWGAQHIGKLLEFEVNQSDARGEMPWSTGVCRQDLCCSFLWIAT